MAEVTHRALLARGWSADRADWIVSLGYTVTKLNQQEDEHLITLGLNASEIESIRNGGRPPIPKEIVIKLLHESKRTCCICRESKPIIIHHIVQWSVSHDHSEGNLVILCLEHHGEAHTKSSLSLTLSAEQIREHKAAWIEQVAHADGRAVLGLAHLEGSHWDYINHQRLFELVNKLKIDVTKERFYRALVGYGIVDKFGYLIPYNRWPNATPKSWLYDVGEIMYIYDYTSSLLESVIASLPVIDVTNLWQKSELLALVRPNSWIALQSAFYFKNLAKHQTGRNQNRSGFRRRDDIELNFTFDAWEVTSSSSKVLHLSGYRSAIGLFFVKSVNVNSKNFLCISASCLALGSGFDHGRKMLNQRPPPSHWQRWNVDIDEDSEF